MKKIVNMFYQSVELGRSVYCPDQNVSVFAFNSPDRLTFCEVRFDHQTDYYLMPFISILPVQSKPDKFDKNLFTRAFSYEYEDDLSPVQKAFFLFCIENPETETALCFEDWLSTEGENFIENGKNVLIAKALPSLFDGFVNPNDIAAFSNYYEGYKERREYMDVKTSDFQKILNFMEDLAQKKIVKRSFSAPYHGPNYYHFNTDKFAIRISEDEIMVESLNPSLEYEEKFQAREEPYRNLEDSYIDGIIMTDIPKLMKLSDWEIRQALKDTKSSL